MRHVFLMKKSTASRLNSRITYLDRVVSRDMCGGPIDEYVFVFSAYAEVKAISGKEDVHKGLEYSTSLYQIAIRWRKGVNTGGRIVLQDGTELDIKSVYDPDGRRELLIICAEKNSAEGAYFVQNN